LWHGSTVAAASLSEDRTFAVAASTRGGTRALVASPFLQTGAVKRALLARKNGAATAPPPAPVGVAVY
jgi:hypothetical protein